MRNRIAYYEDISDSGQLNSSKRAATCALLFFFGGDGKPGPPPLGERSEGLGQPSLLDLAVWAWLYEAKQTQLNSNREAALATR